MEIHGRRFRIHGNRREWQGELRMLGNVDLGNDELRCGFPHLWQKRASGGNCAPQVQDSGMAGN